MKVTKARASENRDAIEKAAAALVRERGFDQMSVAAVAAAAGLTHGALYSHYGSKEALTEAATKRAFEDTVKGLAGLSTTQLVQQYLSPMHRDHPEVGCPNAALASEVWRQPAGTRQAFSDGMRHYIELVGAMLSSGDEGQGKPKSQAKAVTTLAAMVGAMALSRAVAEVDPTLSNEILSDVCAQLTAFIDGKSV